MLNIISRKPEIVEQTMGMAAIIKERSDTFVNLTHALTWSF